MSKGVALERVLSFDMDRACMTYLGRNAIWQAVHVLGLGPGDEILVPAYNCGSEIDPLIHRGLTLVPYKVRRTTGIDAEDINAKLKPQTRAVYVTHYFGFPQNLGELAGLCRDKGLFLIEDCALALFSRNGVGAIGHKGDVAVFSFRKTLPLPDGGMLLLNNPDLPIPERLKRPPLMLVLARLVPSLGRYAMRWSGLDFKAVEKSYCFVKSGIGRLSGSRVFSCGRIAVDGTDQPGLSNEDCYNPRISSWAASSVSKRIIANVKPEDVIAKRRANFEFLLQAISQVAGVQPLFEQLPRGVCPIVFPVLTDRRSELCSRLADRRVDSIEWWAGFHPFIRWDEFPDAVYLKGHVLALPVHQDLGLEDMAYIADCLRQCTQ